MFWGVLMGIIAMSILGFVPLFGPLLAGFIAGDYYSYNKPFCYPS